MGAPLWMATEARMVAVQAIPQGGTCSEKRGSEDCGERGVQSKFSKLGKTGVDSKDAGEDPVERWRLDI